MKRWLLAHPRFAFHFTPTYSSWINLVERFFGELTTKWLTRGPHRSVKELVASIRTWIAHWNENPRPYVWHKTADEILETLAGYSSAASREPPRTQSASVRHFEILGLIVPEPAAKSAFPDIETVKAE